MSLIISVYVREGIVMAADSRLTLTFPTTLPDGQSNIVSITSSDSAKKLFLAPNHVGISTCGAADIGGVPIAGFIESFIVEKLKGNHLDVDGVAKELKKYFKALEARPGTFFHIAGYTSNNKKLEPKIYLVNPAEDYLEPLNEPGRQGANWGGEIDILQRLLNDVALMRSAEEEPVPMPFYGIPFEFFTLQDAIDFAFYGIRSTIDTLRFQAREKTVGGPVDVLVITPDDSQWIVQKQLTVQ